MKGKLIVIIAVGVVVLLAGGGGAYYFLKIRRSKPSAMATKPQPKKKLFVSLKPLVVTIDQKGKFGLPIQATYLQVGFQFATVRDKARKAFKSLRPAIRGNVLSLLLNLSPDILREQSARDRMKKRVLRTVNDTIYRNQPNVGHDAFDQIYITRFVTQAG